METQKEGKEINLLLAEAPVPLPPAKWEASTCIQLHNVSTSSSSLVLGLAVSSSVDSSAQGKEGRSSGVGCAKKKTYKYI